MHQKIHTSFVCVNDNYVHMYPRIPALRLSCIELLRSNAGDLELALNAAFSTHDEDAEQQALRRLLGDQPEENGEETQSRSKDHSRSGDIINLVMDDVGAEEKSAATRRVDQNLEDSKTVKVAKSPKGTDGAVERIVKTGITRKKRPASTKNAAKDASVPEVKGKGSRVEAPSGKLKKSLSESGGEYDLISSPNITPKRSPRRKKRAPTTSIVMSDQPQALSIPEMNRRLSQLNEIMNFSSPPDRCLAALAAENYDVSAAVALLSQSEPVLETTVASQDSFGTSHAAISSSGAAEIQDDGVGRTPMETSSDEDEHGCNESLKDRENSNVLENSLQNEKNNRTSSTTAAVDDASDSEVAPPDNAGACSLSDDDDFEPPSSTLKNGPRNRRNKRSPAVNAGDKKDIRCTPPPAKRQRTPKDKGAPKRPKTAYILYCASKRPELLKANPAARTPELTKLAAKAWRSLSEEEKAPFVVEAAAGMQKYKEEIAAYLQGQAKNSSKPEPKDQHQSIDLTEDPEDTITNPRFSDVSDDDGSGEGSRSLSARKLRSQISERWGMSKKDIGERLQQVREVVGTISTETCLQCLLDFGYCS